MNKKKAFSNDPARAWLGLVSIDYFNFVNKTFAFEGHTTKVANVFRHKSFQLYGTNE